ncbi:MAG: sulfotransferase [Kangiellaceae bacterium]|nr:sulfotransferase [Kangiellaceae bacterium]
MSFAENYSLLDRTLHHLAFSVPGVQKLLADLETDLNKKELEKIESKNEIFVTGLPRSGTTLLLDFLYQSNEFCTYSYRHMPFILAPLLWKKLSKPFEKKSKAVERAHGDGMEVSFDSPEAFEEVIWLSFLKDNYVQDDRLKALTLSNTSKTFAEKFQVTLKKLILESSQNESKSLDNPKRYISKNNANCARLSVLTRLFPTAIILVPFREPLAHIGSLMKQHQQFLNMHKDDSFAKNYMRWLGHYDFGENFKPIDFDNWLDSYEGEINYDDANFWLRYWIAGYSNILEQQSEQVYLVDYNKLLKSPVETLSNLAKKSKLKDHSSFIKNAEKIRQPTSKPQNDSQIDANLLAQANQLYTTLKQSAL